MSKIHLSCEATFKNPQPSEYGVYRRNSFCYVDDVKAIGSADDLQRYVISCLKSFLSNTDQADLFTGTVNCKFYGVDLND